MWLKLQQLGDLELDLQWHPDIEYIYFICVYIIMIYIYICNYTVNTSNIVCTHTHIYIYAYTYTCIYIYIRGVHTHILLGFDGIYQNIGGIIPSTLA